MTEPLISVIMPAYNADRFIAEAIRSVQGQTHQNWELLVLDDGSVDDTCPVVAEIAREDPRIRLIKNEKNMGVARTRNRGFDLCKGQYIALLDADDLWQPEKLSRQLELLEKSGADLVYCSYGIIDVRGEACCNDFIVPGEICFESALVRQVISCSTALLRSALVQNNRFPTEYYHEDLVFWLQLLKAGYVARGCVEVLAAYRISAGARASNKGKSALNRWRVYRDCLKIPFFRRLRVFAGYALQGLKKYRSR